MAEMFGKQEGCSRGRGGSMHLFSSTDRFYGGNAIVGAGLPIATGLALANRMRDEDIVTACFFGEGAVAEGAFHEAVNLAALWGLPVLFVCENNGYAMGTALERSESEPDIANKAASYRIATESVDGMDVLAVRSAAERAIQSIRDEGKPQFLECKTYRFRPHSMFDPELYREKAEVEEWKQKDPIAAFQARSIEEGTLTARDVEGIEASVRAEIAEAVEFAEAGSAEPVDELDRFVYAEGPR